MSFLDTIIGRKPRSEEPELQTVAHRRQMAQRGPSFTEMLPWTSFSPDDRVFELRDGSSLGLMFELKGIATEAVSPTFLAERAHKIQEALQAVPESDTAPWVLQFFLNDELSLESVKSDVADYIREVHKADPDRGKAVFESKFTQAYLAELGDHLTSVTNPQGIFTDTLVTGQPWKGQIRRVRCCVYKRFAGLAREYIKPLEQLEEVSTTLLATFAEAGVQARRCTGKDIYDWMLPFFNPAVPWIERQSELLKIMPYPGDRGPDDGSPIHGWDLADHINLSEPRSDAETGTWIFDGRPVKCLTLQNMRARPDIGHFSAERRSGKESFARFDRLPPGAMLSISIVIEPQDRVERHIERIRDSSRAQTAVASETHRECGAVLQAMATGDKLFPTCINIFLPADSTEELNSAISQLNAQLNPTGLRFIEPRQDLVALDMFMRALPMGFDPAFDARSMRRSRLTFASHIAALLPVYGRGRGTGKPGFFFWNRGGEPLLIDPLNKYDRQKNAHMLVLGPTGAGKSATLNYLTMAVMAIYRPRFVIVDAGKSFKLLMDYFKTMDLSTHSVTLSYESEVSLPPFLNAVKLLDDPDVMRSYRAAEAAQHSGSAEDLTVGSAEVEASIDALTRQDVDETEDDPDEADRRDYLGEMLITAIMMITGGESREIEKLGRADRYLITRAIIQAADQARREGREHPLAHDVALRLISMQADSSLSLARQARAEDMGQSMMSFTQGLRGRLFNREGSAWPDADVTLVEMGSLTQDGYEDALAVAYTSLIDSVQQRGELYQAQDRPLIFLTDEGHLITTNELLGPKVAKGTKMWRKLNTWFWLATQNVKDFPDSMSRVLSMCEFWMLLTMDKSEIEEVSRFRSLTEEQVRLMESAQKEPQKYTEGVLLTAKEQYLFRNVPPALPIALAMTEGHEKAMRRRIMEDLGCTEMEAAQDIARQISRRRGNG